MIRYPREKREIREIEPSKSRIFYIFYSSRQGNPFPFGERDPRRSAGTVTSYEPSSLRRDTKLCGTQNENISSVLSKRKEFARGSRRGGEML